MWDCGLWDILWSVFSHVNLGKDLLVVGSREKEKGLKDKSFQALSFTPPVVDHPEGKLW